MSRLGRLNPYEVRREAERIIGEDRVPLSVLEELIEQHGDRGEGAIEFVLQPTINGVFQGRAFDAVEEAVEAVGEALRIKQENPEELVKLVVLEDGRPTTQTLVHVCAYRHVVPGFGYGGFEWDTVRHQARARVMGQGFWADDNYEVLERSYHVPWFREPLADDQREEITRVLDGMIWEDWPRGES